MSGTGTEKTSQQKTITRSISFRRRALRKIDRAARVTGRSRSDFVERAAFAQAEAVLKAIKLRTDTLTGRSA